MGSFFSRQDGGGGVGPKLNKTIQKPTKKKSARPQKSIATTLKRVKTALRNVGFKASVVDSIDEKIYDSYKDFSDEDATKEIWSGYIRVQDFTRNADLVELLYKKASIKRSKAYKYATVFGALWNDGHTTFDHVVEMIIEYSLQKYKPLRPANVAHLLRRDHEFMNPFVGNYCLEIATSTTKILHANVSRSIAMSSLIKHLGVTEEMQLFFHATNWAGAVNMINDRPLVNAGRLCLDFGKRQSFYSFTKD